MDWKAHPVTKAVFAQLHERIFDLHQQLGDQAGLDPVSDRHKAGYIAALKDIVNTDMDTIGDSNGD